MLHINPLLKGLYLVSGLIVDMLVFIGYSINSISNRGKDSTTDFYHKLLVVTLHSATSSDNIKLNILFYL